MAFQRLTVYLGTGCTSIQRNWYNPLLSHWDKAVQAIHHGHEALKALVQRGQWKHTQPRREQTIQYGRLDNEA